MQREEDYFGEALEEKNNKYILNKDIQIIARDILNLKFEEDSFLD